MKHLILALLLLLLAGKWCPAQCDKRITWVSEKQEMINGQDEVEETRDDVLDIITSKDSIKINPRGTEKPFVALVKEMTCEWKELLKEGKTSYKISIVQGNGETVFGSLDIEGKDGKLYLYVQMPKLGEGKRIRVSVSKYVVE